MFAAMGAESRLQIVFTGPKTPGSSWPLKGSTPIPSLHLSMAGL
jgi:hypothetical protein